MGYAIYMHIDDWFRRTTSAVMMETQQVSETSFDQDITWPIVGEQSDGSSTVRA